MLAIASYIDATLPQMGGLAHFKATIHLPPTRRWERTNPPSLGSSASVRAIFAFVDAGAVNYDVAELTYLRAAIASTPRKTATSQSIPASPSPSGNPWKRRVTLMVDDSEDTPQSPTPAKRRRLATPPSMLAPPVLHPPALIVSSSPPPPPPPSPATSTHTPTVDLPVTLGLEQLTPEVALAQPIEKPAPSPTKVTRPRRSTRK